MRDAQPIWEAVEASKAPVIARSEAVFDKPETLHEEFRSVAAHRDALAAQGFRITDDAAGIATAVIGEAGDGGRVIAILGGFAALPGLSQAPGVAGRRPIEEGGAARTYMVRAGPFDDAGIPCAHLDVGGVAPSVVEARATLRQPIRARDPPGRRALAARARGRRGRGADDRDADGVADVLGRLEPARQPPAGGGDAGAAGAAGPAALRRRGRRVRPRHPRDADAGGRRRRVPPHRPEA